jgi:DNA replication protein DnaC
VRKPACELCDDLGVISDNVPVGHPQFGKLLPCACQSASLSARMQQACGLNDDERLLTLDSITDSGPGTIAMKAAARAWLARPVGMFTVYGTWGNAKTILLMALVNECLKRGLPAVYTTFPALLDHIREGFKERQTTGEYGSASVRTQRFHSIRVLAIDELEDAQQTEWMLEFEKTLFDRRYRDGNSGLTGTLIATNKPPLGQSRGGFLPDKIASRLYDGRNVVIENRDADMRPLMSR